MKKLIFPFLALGASIIGTGCTEKFNVAAPYKNITVVYGFLDMADTAHYIRIQKAFLDQEKSAITMAQTSDSSFYSNISVKIKRIDFLNTVNPARVKDSIELVRVDMNLEGYPKEQGAFFNAPNYAYKFKDLLDPHYNYRLIIRNLTTGAVDSAETPVLNDKDFINVFRVDVIDDSGLNRAGLDFAATTANKNFQYNVYYPYIAVPPYNNFNQVKIAQSVFRFHWSDSDMRTGSLTPKYYDFNAGFSVPVNNQQIPYKINNIDFYSAMGTGMGKAPDNVARLVDRCELFVYLGTPDYYDYQQASLQQGIGLTGSEIQPMYTNIRGENVLGLFTSRAIHSGPLTITKNTIDSLKVHLYTAKANIKGTTYR